MSQTVALSLLAVTACYLVFRFVSGRLRFPRLLAILEGEGIVLSERWVVTRYSFPMIRRISMSNAYLTRRRFVTVHALSLNKVVQAPLGPHGSPGTEAGRFEVERRGKRALLAIRTTIRGGGRIRLHVKDPGRWLEAIRAAGD